MKIKKSKKKLSLNRLTIANLNHIEMKMIYGGKRFPYNCTEECKPEPTNQYNSDTCGGADGG